jgi:hypothetical protein
MEDQTGRLCEEVEYQGELREFVSLLKLGERVHVGKAKSLRLFSIKRTAALRRSEIGRTSA